MKIWLKDTFQLPLSLPLAAGLAVLLLVYSDYLMDPVLLPRFLALNLVCIGFLLAVFMKDRGQKIMQILYTHSWLWAYAIYLILSAFSLSFSINPADGFFEWSVAFLLFSFFMILASWLSGAEKMDGWISLFTLAVLAAGVSQYMTMIRTFGVTHHSSYLVSSVFGHKNIFAECLLLLLPINFYGVLRQKGIRKILSSAALLLSLVFILLLLSRGVWVAFLGASVLTSLLYVFVVKGKMPFHTHRRMILMGGAVAGMLAMGAVYFYSQADTPETLVKQLTSITDISHQSTEDRMGLWKRSLTLFGEKPITGHGTGSWKTEVLRLGTLGLKSAAGGINFVRPHNDFLWVLAENGLLGFLAYFSFFLLLFIHLIQSLKTHPNDALRYLTACFGLTAYMIISCVSFPKERVEHGVILAITLLPFLQQTRQPTFKNRGKLVSGLFVILMTSILSAGFYVGLERFDGEKHIFKAIELQQKQQWDAALQELHQVNLRFLPLDHTGTPVQLYTGSIYMLKFQPKYGCSEYQRALAVHPYNPEIIAGLAQCYKLSGQKEQAEVFFKKALDIAPFNSQILIKLTNFYLENHRNDEAIATLRKADPRSKDPLYDQAVETIIQLEIKNIFHQPELQHLVYWLEDSTLTKPDLNHVFRESIFQKQPFVNQLEKYAARLRE